MEYTEKLYKMKELGLRMVEYSYANQYAELGDLNDLSEFEESIKKEFKNLFEVE